MSSWELWRIPAWRAFGGSPNPKRDTVRTSLLGVPLDSTSSFYPGSRFAPSAVRAVSESLEWYSYVMERALPENMVYDEGDLLVKPDDVSFSLRVTSEALRELVEEGRFPVLLGGEHTVTYAATEILDGDSLLVVFDAHLDARDEYLGSRLNHATVMRRILDKLPSECILFVGTRALSEEEEEFARSTGLKFISSRRVWAYGPRRAALSLREAVRGKERVYISIDVDVLDPAYAPGVGTPEPLGLDPHSLLALLGPLLSSANVVGADVVEVNPLLDRSSATSFMAAKLIIELAAAAQLRRELSR
ncbi:MAG: agmatinase [Fervidicoccaceae archaeon]